MQFRNMSSYNIEIAFKQFRVDLLTYSNVYLSWSKLDDHIYTNP
jgi:hypothetical protein